MKLVGLHFGQLTVNDLSADKRSGVNLALSSPTPSPSFPFFRRTGEVGGGGSGSSRRQ